MIDNYKEPMALIKKMEEYLPIPTQPTKKFIRAMKKNGIKVKSNQKLQIESVTYLGDEGGIGCCVGLLKKGEDVVISLTHIRVKTSHSVGKEIREYQKNRINALALQNIKRNFIK